MADPIAVAQRRARADARLKASASELADLYGVEFKSIPQVAKKEQAVAGAYLIENIADLLEQVIQLQKARTNHEEFGNQDAERSPASA